MGRSPFAQRRDIGLVAESRQAPYRCIQSLAKQLDIAGQVGIQMVVRLREVHGWPAKHCIAVMVAVCIGRIVGVENFVGYNGRILVNAKE